MHKGHSKTLKELEQTMVKTMHFNARSAGSYLVSREGENGNDPFWREFHTDLKQMPQWVTEVGSDAHVHLPKHVGGMSQGN